MFTVTSTVLSACRLTAALGLAVLVSPALLPSHEARAADEFATCSTLADHACIAKLLPEAKIYENSECYQREDEEDCYTCVSEPGSHCIKFGTVADNYKGIG
jgi:hypothetical protein